MKNLKNYSKTNLKKNLTKQKTDALFFAEMERTLESLQQGINGGTPAYARIPLNRVLSSYKDRAKVIINNFFDDNGYDVVSFHDGFSRAPISAEEVPLSFNTGILPKSAQFSRYRIKNHALRILAIHLFLLSSVSKNVGLSNYSNKYVVEKKDYSKIVKYLKEELESLGYSNYQMELRPWSNVKDFDGKVPKGFTQKYHLFLEVSI